MYRTTKVTATLQSRDPMVGTPARKKDIPHPQRTRCLEHLPHRTVGVNPVKPTTNHAQYL